MLDIVFFSTNPTKVAHFRYLGNRVGLKVKSFKEANYYASYHEPRIDDRTELLERSYRSAFEKWKRRQRKPDDDTSTFFFEDTSVRIDALSNEDEIPGVNVKYWMRDMTFKKLDRLLKDNGNNRKAIVRSDIVMHLPKRWRELLGTNNEFLWVFGETKGTVAESEPDITPNPVYPWLDDKTFNRWFIPEGTHSSISAISLEDANRSDFRRKAFDQIVDVLSKLKLLTQTQPMTLVQLDLPRVPTAPSIFVMCGPTCAGKTTTAGWLVDTYGIPHIEASDFMYKAFWERQGLRSEIKIGDFAEAALQTQPEIVAKPIADHIIENQFKMAVVTGFRSMKEVEIFKAGISDKLKVELIYLDAPYEIRLERAIKRNRDSVTPEKFLLRNQQEDLMGLGEIKTSAEAVQLVNDTTLSKLRSKFKKKYQIATADIEFSRHRFDTSSLEPFILMLLLDFASSAEWLTTTEITAHLNKKFGVKKHKDNVSRYFNQEYHPYFEVRLRVANERPTRTVEYKISATGISAAKLLIKNPNDWLTQKKAPTVRLDPQMPIAFS